MCGPDGKKTNSCNREQFTILSIALSKKLTHSMYEYQRKPPHAVIQPRIGTTRTATHAASRSGGSQRPGCRRSPAPAAPAPPAPAAASAAPPPPPPAASPPPAAAAGPHAHTDPSPAAARGGRVSLPYVIQSESSARLPFHAHRCLPLPAHHPPYRPCTTLRSHPPAPCLPASPLPSPSPTSTKQGFVPSPPSSLAPSLHPSGERGTRPFPLSTPHSSLPHKAKAPALGCSRPSPAPTHPNKKFPGPPPLTSSSAARSRCSRCCSYASRSLPPRLNFISL